MKIIQINKENINTEHICCGFSDKKCSDGYQAKKDWLKDKFDSGYVFKRFDVRGKVFIEYCPAENAWMPLDAPGYMNINCFWVSGQFKGKGYAKQLFQECLNDSKNKNGITVLVGKTKKPFLNDKKFFQLQGFELADFAPPYFELWYKKLNK